jgi:tRNA-splicing ligase RtcB
MITHKIRTSFEHVFNKSADRLGLNLIYDVAHNIAKIEDHIIDGKRQRVWLHRKGATRCFGPGSEAIPAYYHAVGQPVLIPGTMGSHSSVMVGRAKAMELSFGSTTHGAGRVLSCSTAKQQYRGSDIQELLRKRGIIIRSTNEMVLAEAAPSAYKDVDRVVEVIDNLGIATKVVRLVPIAVVKG